jgi:hypothetical protein
MYHVGPANFSDISDTNSGDAAGDADFMIRAAGLGYLCSTSQYVFDCADAEQTEDDLVVSKVVVEADSRYSEYAECNIANGTYSCECRDEHFPPIDQRIAKPPPHHHPTVPCNATIGKILVVNESGYAHDKPSYDPHFGAPSAYRYYFYNSAQKLGGLWYSALSNGECGNPAAGGNCTWRVAKRIKRIKKSCQTAYLFSVVEKVGTKCFSSCSQPLNTSTACWTSCFYGESLPMPMFAGY